MREQDRQKRIHSKSYHITKEEAQKIWKTTDLKTKKELAMDLIDKLAYKTKYSEELPKMTCVEIDVLVSNLILAQELHKVIK